MFATPSAVHSGSYQHTLIIYLYRDEIIFLIEKQSGAARWHFSPPEPLFDLNKNFLPTIVEGSKIILSSNRVIALLILLNRLHDN